jgi:pimeloyl-ACP methyl ester carboxylesterase
MKRLLVPLLLVALAGLVVPPAPATSAAEQHERRTQHRLGRATACQSHTELRAAKGVVLLVHGTGEKRGETWSWSYEPALRARGYATCAVQLPDHGLGDFDVAARYVVAGIRKASRLAERPIAVVGHSQGGALPVWALKFWPGLRARVTDVVSLAGPFDGTQLGNELCAPGRCAPLAWELRRGSHHVAALRSAPLPDGVDVTSVSTQYDEIVRPQPSASRLHGARNVLLQDVCPQDPSDHGLILGDPVAFALTMDALTHDGPAAPGRLPADTCQQWFIPGGDLAGSYVFLQGVGRFATGLTDPRRWVDAEPPVPAYARRWAP